MLNQEVIVDPNEVLMGDLNELRIYCDPSDEVEKQEFLKEVVLKALNSGYTNERNRAIFIDWLHAGNYTTVGKAYQLSGSRIREIVIHISIIMRHYLRRYYNSGNKCDRAKDINRNFCGLA